MDVLVAVFGTLLVCFVVGLSIAVRWYFTKKNQAVDAIITLAQAGGNLLVKHQEQRTNAPK